MPWITLDEARENLKMWLDAEKAVSTGQSYKIGSRSLTRVSLPEIANRINFWRREVEKIETGTRGAVVLRVVPRDL